MNLPRKIIKILIQCYCVVAIQPAYTQLLRIEIEARSENDTYDLISLGKEGILVFFETNQRSDLSKKEVWEFVRYDTLFNELWSAEVVLLHAPDQMLYDRDGENIYFFLAKKTEYQIIAINLYTGSYETFSARINRPNFIIQDFKVYDWVAYIGGSIPPPSSQTFFKTCLGLACFPLLLVPDFIPSKSAYLVYANLRSKYTKEISLQLPGYSEITGIYTDTIQRRFLATITQSKGKNKYLLLSELKLNGLKGKNYMVQSVNPNYMLQQAKMDVKQGGEKILIGTYALKHSESSQGVFYTKMIGSKQYFIQYTSFTRFKNFFNFLSTQDRSKVKKKVSKKHKKGKDVSIELRTLMHELYPIDSGKYILVHEFYYPQYHTEFQLVWMYGRPVETAIEIFDGYKFTHATIACIDSTGQILWDNSMELQNILTFNLTPKTIVAPQANSFIFAYLENAKIHFKNIIDSTEAAENLYLEYKDPELQFRVSETIENNLLYWYDTYALSYGFQRLKQVEHDYVKKRKIVFFVNRVQL